MNETNVVNRMLFYDGCNLNGVVADSVNNYSEVKGSKDIYKKGDVINYLNTDGNKYNIIVLAGHGTEGEISTGSGMGGLGIRYEKTKEISSKKFQDSKEFFENHLVNHFDRDEDSGTPILFLSGCNIVNPISNRVSLPSKISRVLTDVLVIAPSTYVKPELGEKELEIKFEVKINYESNFDFDLTLAASKNGRRIKSMNTILNLTKCKNAIELQNLLCKWELTPQMSEKRG
jgi:hypothetical protein